VRSLSAPVRRPTMSAARIAASFRVSKPEALLQGLLQVDLIHRPASRNVRFLRIAVKIDWDVRADGGLTNFEQNTNIKDGRTRLPRLLSLRRGPYLLPRLFAERLFRLARLAAKFGPEITLRDLTDRFSYDCLWRAEARSKAGKSACGVYLPDLANPRPPDLPPGLLKLRLIKRA
jgi:hypothetical protein